MYVYGKVCFFIESDKGGPKLKSVVFHAVLSLASWLISLVLSEAKVHVYIFITYVIGSFDSYNVGHCMIPSDSQISALI